MSRLPTDFPAWVFDDVHLWEHSAAFQNLDAVAAEFPDPDDPRWHVFEGDHEPLKRQAGPEAWGPATTALVLELVGSEFCQAVARRLGYEVLIADVYGGGMHLSGPGARLDTHVDFSVHPRTGWRRRANLLLFLNRGWDPSWGGLLELRDRRDGPVKAGLTPEFGRLVLFECSERSWHGHPRPIRGDHWRKSVAVYFYDPLDAVPLAEQHDTLWAGEVGT